MRKNMQSLQFIVLMLLIAPACAGKYADGWSLSAENLSIKADSWKLFVSLSVLDEEGPNVAKLFRSQIDQSKQPTVRPKPRLRLGERGVIPTDRQPETTKSYEAQADEAIAFLRQEIEQFSERWNTPMEPSESLQWVHEIDAECVLIVNKKNGTIAIESLSDTPRSDELENVRTIQISENGTATGVAKTVASDPVELERLRKFVVSLAPMTMPDVLTNLPGKDLRIRLTAMVVGFNEETNSYTPSNGGKKHFSVKHTGSNVSSYETPSRKQPGAPPTERPSPRPDINVEDPKFHWEIGLKYFNGDGLKRDIPMALDHFRTAAEKGYAPAQAQMGFMYQMGFGVARDPQKAFFWYGKASDQGNDQAMYNLSCMYRNGEGVERNPAEAAKWIRKAADLGWAYAEAALGSMYAEGDGLERDPVEAFKWFLKAARQDYTSAQFAIGQMYEEGRGVAKDEIEALAWYNLAPTSGFGDKTNHRDLLEQQLGLQASVKARQRAEELRKGIQKKETTPSG
jgi:hypothetical protein